MLIPLTIAAVVGYFLGAIPFGYLVARAYGINIFEHGSKSPGATNVKRVLGKKAGNTVFSLDAIKGAVASGLWLILAHTGAWKYHPTGPVNSYLNLDEARLLAVVALTAAVLGHSFSCFTRFKGGKGVATSAGGFVVLMPVVTLIALAVWFVTFFASRYVSLASILAAVAIPVGAVILDKPPLLVGLAVLIGGFVILLHRANIKRLLNGTENRFVKKSSAAASSSSPNP